MLAVQHFIISCSRAKEFFAGRVFYNGSEKQTSLQV
jgi:hypothetical protein